MEPLIVASFFIFTRVIVTSNEESLKEVALEEVRESMRETVNNIAIIASVAKPFQPLLRTDGESLILHMVNHKGIKSVSGFKGTDTVKCCSAHLGGHEERIFQSDGPISVRFIKFLQFGKI